MKKYLLFVLFLIATTLLFGQKASIDLSFTAVSGSQYQQLDSIKIINIDQVADTFLHWNDTVLTVTFSVVGIGEHTPGHAKILVEYPHSTGSIYLLRVFNPEPDNGILSIYDCLGRTCANVLLDKGRGWYSFQLASGRASLYFVSHLGRSGNETVKLTNTGRSSQTTCHLTEFSFTPSGIGYPKSQILTAFPFSPGDSLRYKGYANNHEVVIHDDPTTSEDYTFHFPGPCQGITAFTYGGQVYNTVEIGTQCWMKENLNIGTMVNSIYTGTPHSECSNNSLIEKYCYNNDSANCALYGGLYDWDEMMQYSTIPGTQGICPSGWHIPSEAEWCTLSTFLDPNADCIAWGVESFIAGGKMKETGYTYWISPNTGATNESGFTALGAGSRGGSGGFNTLGYYTYFWSSSEYSVSDVVYRRLSNDSACVSRYDNSKTTGVSVRCVRTI
ncbi:MAG TPA: FISUMP domain-containing protein [Bacteroidales bacterium]|nr:FISUMP domain-containing protein [Bacteroidales bacterium]HSA43144.1 FISUMP domain-containing protein [Bacteroidales bacterium]